MDTGACNYVFTSKFMQQTMRRMYFLLLLICLKARLIVRALGKPNQSKNPVFQRPGLFESCYPRMYRKANFWKPALEGCLILFISSHKVYCLWQARKATVDGLGKLKRKLLIGFRAENCRFLQTIFGNLLQLEGNSHYEQKKGICV